jgi:hypothetical protein
MCSFFGLETGIATIDILKTDFLCILPKRVACFPANT